MGAIGLLIPIAALAGLFIWFRRDMGQVPAPPTRRSRIPPLTEAVGYVGAVLVAGGGIGWVVNGWNDLADWGRIAVLGGGALGFVAVGAMATRSNDPAAIRLTQVAWTVGCALTAGALGVLLVEVAGASDETSFLVVSSCTAIVAVLLYVVDRAVAQHVVLFVAVLLSAIAALGWVVSDPPTWSGSLVAWAVGATWGVLGKRALLPPSWVAIPLALLTVLIAPTAMGNEVPVAMFAAGIATSAGVMAFGVLTRTMPALILGAVGLFGYVTGAVVRYFGDAVGVPASLTVTGLVLLALAAGTMRLARFDDAARPPPAHLPDTDLRRAS